MAIFYNHIKGCGKNTTGNTDDLPASAKKETTEEVGTGIKGPDALTYTKNPSADLAYVENNPYIYLNNANLSNSTSVDSSLSLGRIITSRSKGQSIDVSFDFKNTMDVYAKNDGTKVLMTSNKYGSNPLVTIHQDCWVTNGKSLIFSDSDYSSETSYNRFAQIVGQTDPAQNLNRGFFNLHGDSTASMEFAAPTFAFHVGNVNIAQTLVVNSSILCNNKCEALYFNATSDRRAKTNITPVKFSALQVVNAIPTYTFNYNNKKEKAIGLIAQEAAEFDLDGFNMVDNLEATGQDGDYMQMKESKLVYVLWKAVQELSAEVEELKAEIASLK